LPRAGIVITDIVGESGFSGDGKLIDERDNGKGVNGKDCGGKLTCRDCSSGTMFRFLSRCGDGRDGGD
jgi:hypothetical protein